MSEPKYVPISIDLLYAGMVVPHDIYDYTQKSMLISKGGIISASKIERLKIFNKGNPTIFVTVETEKVMRRQGLPTETIVSRTDLEEDTGYTEVKSEALEMLERIMNDGVVVVPQKDLCSVSRELSQVLDNTKPSVIVDLVNSLAPVDEYLQRHCINVSLLNGLFGKWLGLPKDAVDVLVLIGLLHDCGKASLPNMVLSAPRPLTGIEFEVVKTHTEFTYSLLSEFPEVVRRAARGHHEKMNGKGYPDGLSGDKIPLMARITAVSDIYDAMTARRSYKGPMSPFSIMGMLRDIKGSELDPRLVDVFINKMPEELIGKPVLLSDGMVGLVHSFDVNAIEYPMVKLGKKIIQTSKSLYCRAMYIEDSDG